jgi:hypothetical protein
MLVIVRASPLRERTAALLESIGLQKPRGIARVVLLSQRSSSEGESRFGGIEQLRAEPNWANQVHALAGASGCRWLVLPSSIDRYLPGAFEAVVELGARDGHTVIGACQVVRDGQSLRIGPEPFRFDYFALLSGFSYIAPGATFIDIRRCMAEGGLDPRFPSAMVYEYLLRTGAAHAVECCAGSLLETEADPFPGVPADWAPIYASEALLATLSYNRSFVTPGALLGLMAALANRVEPYEHMGFYDSQAMDRLANAGAPLTERYREQLGLHEWPEPERDEPGWVGAEPLPARTLRSRIRAGTPRPIWDMLRRTKRAWNAFRSPLY